MKRITLLNGIPDEGYADFEKGLELMKAGGRNGDYSLECFRLRDMNIRYCVGCFGCWVKTPGECLIKDDMPQILRSVIGSDLVVFISPVVMGFVSSCLKRTTDRIIPLVRPYIRIYQNECHHVSRYEKYPKLGLLLLDKNSKSIEDFSIITDVYKRLTINLKTEMAFSTLSNGNMEVLQHEIDCL